MFQVTTYKIVGSYLHKIRPSRMFIVGGIKCPRQLQNVAIIIKCKTNELYVYIF